ncbi:MAG: 23S rRNA (uridine(2552)-2'-O)-methyltransferase RlmE [Rhodanobacteraceae bacterium]
MARSKSSARWLREHFDDPWVKKAHTEGLRARSAYKLDELVDRDKLLRPGMSVMDLGAAPGGWSQLVHERLDGKGKLFALDILPMQPIAGVDFVCGDFREPEVLEALEERLTGQQLDLVLSDMAPNMSGVAVSDQARAMDLAELAADFAAHWLRPGGNFVVKLFHGVGFDQYVRDLRASYKHVIMRKPEASRARSREVYALAMGLKAALVRDEDQA